MDYDRLSGLIDTAILVGPTDILVLKGHMFLIAGTIDGSFDT